MIFVSVVFIGLLAAIVTGLRLNAAVDAASRRLRVLVGGYGDAGLLVEARLRFRKRQRRVESAVNTGTSGVQAAHRSLSSLFGATNRDQGAGVYDSVRAFNRGIGRTVSGLFAPKPRRESQSLEEWRQANDSDHDDTRDKPSN